MLVFALPEFERLLPGADGFAPGRFSIDRFPNGEWHLELETPVGGRDCALLGSVAPPDPRLVSLLLLAHTLQAHDPGRIRAVLPYLGYARQDRPEPGASPALAWVGALLAACGVDEVLTIDVHSELAPELLPMPLTSLSPAGLFARALKRHALPEPSFVAPDEGAVSRCEALARASGSGEQITYLTKERTAAGVVHHEVVGPLGRSAVVVDDILDTGGTLVSCCRALKERGVRRTVVAVTHGLFTGNAWRELWELGVEAIYTTDSVPEATTPREGVSVLAAGELLLGALRARAAGEPAPTTV
jgi:ribose-phosphate pyrophosphokinase